MKTMGETNWERQWTDSRFAYLGELMTASREQAMSLILSGDIDEAVALFDEQVPLWAMIVSPLRDQADAIRGEQP